MRFCKGDYDKRRKTLETLYKNVDGTSVDYELTADLVGDYLFTEYDFVKSLSTENRNLFQKIYDRIKYMFKLATAGSKEARELEKVMHNFEKALRESGKLQKNTAENSGTNFSIERTKTMSWADQINGTLYNGNNIRRNDTLVVGSPSEKVKADGVSDKPLAVPVRVVTKATSGKDVSHSIKRGKIAKLDVGIQEAPIVAVNPDRNALIYITNVKQGGLPIVATFDMDATFDGDEVHQATSIHLQTDTMTLLQSLPKNATIYVQKKGELEAVGVTNNLRSLAANIKFTDDSISPLPENVNTQKHKQSQFEIIQATNPMWDDYHTGIRSVNDIRTWEEVLALNDESEGQFVWGDYSREDTEQALKDNSITVYSSHPIENGAFVSTSYIQAREYTGGKSNSKVYSKTVPLNDVAWINGDEGQFARTVRESPLKKKRQVARHSLHFINFLMVSVLWALKQTKRNLMD